MATRSGSALASLSARLRPISAATAAGGWRRLLSDDPTKGSRKDTQKERVEDEDKRLEDPNMREELPVASSAHPVHTQAQSENISIKEQLEQSRKAMNQLKDQLEKAELENQLLKNQIHKAECDNSFKDHLEQSRKETKQLKDQLEKTEGEIQMLKDYTHKDIPVWLENIISEQAFVLEAQLGNHRVHIDGNVCKIQQCSEEMKDEVEIAVANLKQKCARRAENSETAIKILDEKNAAFPETLAGKVQETQYIVGTVAASAGAVLGVVVFLAFQFLNVGK